MTIAQRDERQAAVDNAADRLSFLVLAYGLLAVIAIRGFNGQDSWELLGLVVLAGLAGLVYRIRERVFDRRSIAIVGVTILFAAATAGILALLSPR